MIRVLSALAVSACLAAPALAQETVDIGVIKNSDITVVQRLLYPKKGRTEVGVHLGVMPFDAYLTTPNVQLTFDMHRSESFALSAAVGGGYGLKNATYRELTGPAYQIAPDAYRYLASALVGVQWAPVYAKANLNGSRIVHFDVYGTARAGITLSQSVIPKGGTAVAPTVSLGVGGRVFQGPRGTVRLETRDDLMVEHRQLTDTTHFKQVVNLTVGYTMLSKPKAGRR